MSQKYRDAYMNACGRHGIGSERAADVLNHANTLQRAAEVDCSFADPELRAYWEKRAKAARVAILSLVRGECVPEFQGDPRGRVVTIKSGDRRAANAWDIVVPSRGFTSAEFARLERVNDARLASKS